MTGFNVMVVDDSQITAKKIGSMLESLGHVVVATAKTGREAVDRYGDLQPDLVTMDVTMPDMDGIEATGHIINAHPDARIVVVTSHGQNQMVRDALEAGAKGYILKPFDKDKLKTVLDKIQQF